MDYRIHTRDVVGRDSFGLFLDFIKLKPWQGALAGLAFYLVYVFVMSAFFGVLTPKNGLELNSLSDGSNMLGFFIIYPIVFYFYLAQPKAIADLYHLVIPLSPEPMHRGLLRASRILHRSYRIWVLPVLSGLVVVILGVLFVNAHLGTRWYSVNWWMGSILQLSRFFFFYGIISIIVRHLLAAFNLNRIYNHIKLPVLVGESKYGPSFNAITKYGLNFAGFGAALGFFIAIRYLYATPVFPEDAIYLTVYIVLIPLSFSLPFWQAHANMRDARKDALDRIELSLQEEYDRLMKDVPDLPDLETSSERVGMLRTLLELTEKAPTWPFESWVVYRVFAATILPFVMTGLGFLVDLLF